MRRVVLVDSELHSLQDGRVIKLNLIMKEIVIRATIQQKMPDVTDGYEFIGHVGSLLLSSEP